MKKIAFIIIMLATALSIDLAAQENHLDDRKDQIEATRIAFITKQIGLTSEQSMKFWPIFNEYQEKLRSLRRDKLPQQPINNMSEEEAGGYLKAVMETEMEEIALKKEYLNKLTSAISNQQIVRLIAADRAFKERLIQRLANRGGKNN